MAKVYGNGVLENRGNKVWRFRFSLGWSELESRYKYSSWHTIHGTRQDAIKAKDAYRIELENGIKPDAETKTFAEFASEYLEKRAKDENHAPSTVRYYKYIVGTINKHIGDLPIKEIDNMVIDAVIAKMRKEGIKQYGIWRVWQMLYQIFKGAVRQDYIMRNPCDKVDPPKKPQRPEPVYLEPAEVARLVAALEAELSEAERLENTHRTTTPRTKEPEHRYERGKSLATLLRSHVMATFLGLATGCRMGEVLGFTWGAVDFEQSTIKVKQQSTKDGVRDTKTPQSKRTITLDADTLGRLKVWKRQQAEFLLSFGVGQSKETPVVTNEYGGFHDPRGFEKWWRTFRKANDFENLKFHKLRHTQATLLIAQGMDFKTVQARLGHTLASTTLDLYAHAMPAKDKEAADIVGTILTTPAPPRGEVINL